MNNTPAIEVEALTKVYGKTTVVDDISFSVRRGEIFGLLGPNGAGKTTTLEIIEGLRKPTSGKVRVCGLDTVKQAEKIKPIIGVKLQSTYFFEVMTVKETVDIFRVYGSPKGFVRAALDSVAPVLPERFRPTAA